MSMRVCVETSECVSGTLTMKRHHQAEKSSTGNTTTKYFIKTVDERPQTQQTPKPHAQTSVQNVPPSTTASHRPPQPRSRPSSLGSSLVQKKGCYFEQPQIIVESYTDIYLQGRHQQLVDPRPYCNFNCWPRRMAAEYRGPADVSVPSPRH